MLNLPKIAHNALTSTSKTPRWWIFALLQAISFSIISPAISNPKFLQSAYVLWFVLALVLLTTVTVWLWLDIDLRSSGKLRRSTLSLFINSCITAFGVITFACAVVIFARLLYGEWIFFVLVSSLVAATAVLAMLFAVITEQKFFKAFALAFDTWTKKASLAAAVAFMLILGHAFFYAISQSLWYNSSLNRSFEVLTHSATIWVLLAFLIAISAVVVALLNCFLVLLFIEIIRRKKDEAEAAEMAKQPVLEPNI